MKKIFLSALIVASSLSFTSCEDYLGDVNYDQNNRADFEKLVPSQMLAGAINNYATHQVITLSNYGNRAAYVWGLNSGFTATDAAWDYTFTSNDYTALFENTFLFADNFQDILDKEAKNPHYEYHYGISKVFKVMCMDYATALYGDVPYTQAFKSNILTPKYDDDKAIIPALFTELDDARNYLNTADPDVVPLGSEDIVFHGDMAKWSQFVNTIELKLLMRLSKTTDAALVTLRNNRFAALTQDFITEDVTFNPGFNTSVVAQRSPMFRNYGLNEGFSDWTSANRANAAGDYIAKVLNGELNDANVTTGIVDPRRTRLFTTVGTPAKVVGNVQGVFPAAAISRFASFFFGRAGSSADMANKNGCERDAYLMLAAESYFLQAEAFQRGYLTGDAHQAFNDGVTASFNFYSRPWGDAAVTALNPVTYLAAIDAKNGLGWTGSTNKISAIMMQKYLALAQWHGIELYIDHMRTGFPVLPLPANVTEVNRPYRLIYPTSEYSSNSANVPNMSLSDVFTNNSKTPYYLQ